MDNVEECNKLVKTLGNLSNPFDLESQKYLYEVSTSAKSVELGLSFLISKKYLLSYINQADVDYIKAVNRVITPTYSNIWDSVEIHDDIINILEHVSSVLFKRHINAVLSFDDSKLLSLVESFINIWKIQSGILLTGHGRFFDNAADDNISSAISIILFKNPNALTYFINILNKPDPSFITAKEFKSDYSNNGVLATRYKYMLVYVLAQIFEKFVASDKIDLIRELHINYIDLIVLNDINSNRYFYAYALLLLNSLNVEISEDALNYLLLIIKQSNFNSDIVDLWNLAIDHLHYNKNNHFIIKSFELIQIGLNQNFNIINLISVLNSITVYYIHSGISVDVFSVYLHLFSVDSINILLEVGKLFSNIKTYADEDIILYDQIISFLSLFDINAFLNRLIHFSNTKLHLWTLSDANCFENDFLSDYDIYIESIKDIINDIFDISPKPLLNQLIKNILETTSHETQASLTSLICYESLDNCHLLAILDKIKSLSPLELSSTFDFILTSLFCQQSFQLYLHLVKDLLFQRFAKNVQVMNIWSKRLAKCIVILNDMQSLNNVMECIQYILLKCKPTYSTLKNYCSSILSLSYLFPSIYRLDIPDYYIYDPIYYKCLLILSVSRRQIPRKLLDVIPISKIISENEVGDAPCLLLSEYQSNINLLVQLYIQNNINNIPRELYQTIHPGLLLLTGTDDNTKMKLALEYVSKATPQSCYHCVWASIAYSSFLIKHNSNIDFCIEMVRLLSKKLKYFVLMSKSIDEPINMELDSVLEYKVNRIHSNIKCLKGTILEEYYDENRTVCADACIYLSLVNSYYPEVTKLLMCKQAVILLESVLGDPDTIANKIALSLLNND